MLDYHSKQKVPSVLAMTQFPLQILYILPQMQYDCFNTKLEHLLFILCVNTLESRLTGNVEKELITEILKITVWLSG